MRLVCPHEPALLKRLNGRTLVVRAEDTGAIVQAAGDARARNALERVLAKSDAPLAEIALSERWRGIPIDLAVPSCGTMGPLLKQIAPMQQLKLRVVLPADPAEYPGAKVLASLGIAVAIDIAGASDYDALADLMSYALIGPVHHAPVEPFATMAEGFRIDARCADWASAEYDDAHTLHLNRDGAIALSARELAAGQFFGGLDTLDSLALADAMRKRGQAWRDLFVRNHFCARCRAFRLCRGRLGDGKTAPDGCDTFFDEAIEVLARKSRAVARRTP